MTEDSSPQNAILTQGAQIVASEMGLLFKRRIKLTTEARRDIEARRSGPLIVLIHPSALASWDLKELLKRAILIAHDLDCTSTQAAGIQAGERRTIQ